MFFVCKMLYDACVFLIIFLGSAIGGLNGLKIDVEALSKELPGSESLYRQFKAQVRGAILSGFYRPGERIESERAFARQGNVSFPTVARALRELAEEGWLRRKVGSGTFVATVLPVAADRLKRIAVLYYATDTPYFSGIFGGVQEACGTFGIEPVKLATGMTDEAGRTALKQAVETESVDGVLGLPLSSYGLMRDLAALARRGFPVVLAGVYFDEIPCPAVVADSEAGARQATRYLLDLGHQNLAFLGTRPRYPFSMTHADILRGIQKELDGRPLREVLLPIGVDEHDPAMRRQVAALFDRRAGGRPTAVVCEADGHARLLYAILAEQGLRVPADVSIIGFGDFGTAAWGLDPPLTSVAWPLRRLGERAVRLLAAERGETQRRMAVRMILDTSLVVRASTAPPRGKDAK